MDFKYHLDLLLFRTTETHWVSLLGTMVKFNLCIFLPWTEMRIILAFDLEVNNCYMHLKCVTKSEVNRAEVNRSL